ncbi:serine hydrolase [Sinomonas sp. R1AF57]|uniref:serine hydrolase domain-containing protein n=1 Tax=Sinomonas sp. R1AF57 TaxID=2020377 RepID=UPI000B617886|nr:serine hydrolase domain-containing protein [Sinomonas sp. R1AF57]ASN51311.1 D-alanyl-D-alanine carboxypeptidase [Sinomonas sp. R1AF57]
MTRARPLATAPALAPAAALAAAALALALAGCTPASTAPAASSSAGASTPTGGAEAGSGASPSSSAPAIAKVGDDEIRTAFNDAAKEMQVPGAVLLLKRPGQPNLELAYGTRERGGSEAVTVGDHIRVGSNTKTWTGTAILQLAQEGKIGLKDPVSKYRDGVPNGDRITIEQLLEMRSGLYNYTFDPDWNRAVDADRMRVWKPDELLKVAFSHAPTFDPGAKWEYSNTNTVLLGTIAEKLDGKPLEQIFRDRLFTPLGLTETQLPAPDSSAIAAPFARGYSYGTFESTIETSLLPPDQLASARAGTLVPTDYTEVNPSWAWAAGSGISTAPELATWVEALGSGRLLSADMQRTRMESIQMTQPNAGYGMNIAQFGAMYGHTGELPGYNSFMGYDPANRVTLVTWANLAPLPDNRAPATELAKLVIGKLYRAS